VGRYNKNSLIEADLISIKQELLSRPCPSCSSVEYESSERDIVDYLEELVTITGSRLEIISSKSEEGAQISSLGRIGAILRFRPSAGKNTIAQTS